MAKILRPYQEKLKADIYKAWRDGHRNVMAVMQTGLGKTACFCNIAMDFAVHPKDKSPTAILVHRRELVQQISLTLAEEGVTHNIIAPRKVILGIVAAQRQEFGRQFYDYNAAISVISVDTLNARITKHEKWARTIRFWIVDEAAHLLKDNKWGRAVAYFPDAIGLGVTATPSRLDGKGLGSETDGVFDHMVEGPKTKWAITNGFLSKYKVAVPHSDYQSFLKKASSSSDYSKKSMTEASQQSKITGDVVENYLRFAEGKQAIVFATDIATAERMTENFNEAGVPAKLLTSLCTDKERLDGMVSFKEKKTNVLVNVDLFDEGLDAPGIEVVILARPTMSLAKLRQQIGRGLRPAPGKEFALIIDHVGNVMRHGLPCAHVDWSLDRRVKRQQKNNLMRICENPMCMAPYDRVEKCCPYCQHVPEVKGTGMGRIPPEMVDGDLYLIDPETLDQLEKDTVLEDPADVGERVAHVAGHPAGVKAKNNQIERINVQRDLAETIAVKAGEWRAEGYDDREVHKLFFIHYNMTISQALSKPKSEMLRLVGILEGLGR
jgi:superfamily II DNA or RNA helicase